QRHHGVGLRCGHGAERRPLTHQLAAFFEKIAAAVCLLDLGADAVGERHFSQIAGERGLLARPGSEARSEPVARRVDNAERLERILERIAPDLLTLSPSVL